MADFDFVKVGSSDVGQRASCVTLQVLGFGDSANDPGAETVPSVELVQPVGFATRPTLTSTSEALVMRRGDEVIALYVVDKGQQNHAASGPALSDLAVGETRVYAGNTQVQVHDDGTIVIVSAGVVIAKWDGTVWNFGAASAAAFVALASLVNANLTSMVTAHNGHIHNDPQGGTTSAPVVPMSAPSDVSATKVKAT